MVYSELLKKAGQTLNKEKEFVEPKIYMGLESSVAMNAEAVCELIVRGDLPYSWMKKSDDGRYLFAFSDREEKDDVVRYYNKLMDAAVEEAIELPVSDEYINNIIIAKNRGDLIFHQVPSSWLEGERRQRRDPLLWGFSRDKYLTNLMLENNPVTVEISRVANIMFPNATSAEMEAINQVLISVYQRVENIVREEKIIQPFSFSETVSAFSSILELKCSGVEEINYFSVIEDLRELNESSIITNDNLNPIVDKLQKELSKRVNFSEFACPEGYDPINDETWPILCEGTGDMSIPSLIDLCLRSYKENKGPTIENCIESLAAHLFLLASGIKAKEVQTCVEKAAIEVAQMKNCDALLLKEIFVNLTEKINGVLNENNDF